MRNNDYGLLAFESPTGFGKTYSASEAIAEYSHEENSNRKIIFLTPMKKNLPMGDLKKMYADDERFQRDVLFLPPTLEGVQSGLNKVEVPEDFQTEAYCKLQKVLKRYEQIKKGAEKELIDIYKTDKVEPAEKAFRREIRNMLKRNFSNKKARFAAIYHDFRYQWIGELYPAVYTNCAKILLMSVDKFLSRNDTLVEDAYEFLTNDISQGAIIFIDEFDSSKETIQKAIIKQALKTKVNYIQLFNQIHNCLNLHAMSHDLEVAVNACVSLESEYSFARIIEKANEIYADYMLEYAYKTEEEDVDRKQNFIFHDGMFQTLLRGEAQYVRTKYEEHEKRVKIHFEKKKEFYKNKSDTDINIFDLLRQLNHFFRIFNVLVMNWAQAYMNQENARRNPRMDAMTLENARDTILNYFGLAKEQKELLADSMCSHRSFVADGENLIPDMSFYVKGFQYFMFNDHDRHNEYTEFQYVNAYDTAEKIMLYLSQRCSVIGISATATIPTVVGNYDIGYLKDKLNGHFYEISETDKRRFRKELSEIWKPYETGLVKIETKMIEPLQRTIDLEERCRTIFSDKETAFVATTLIQNVTCKEHEISRYAKLLAVMTEFYKNEELQSMLCLNMILAKKEYPPFDIQLIRQLASLVIQDLGIEARISDNSVVVMDSNRFDEQKKQLIERLQTGEKILILSSYQTLGAGQNLQYPIPNGRKVIELCPYQNDGDMRHFMKDIDGIYLGEITNLAVNTSPDTDFDEHRMLELFFHAEELYQNYELKFEEREDVVKLGFARLTGEHSYKPNLTSRCESIDMQATQIVIQAVGRICRTYMKNSLISIYADKELLGKINPNEMEKRLIPPELQAVVDMAKKLPRDYTKQETVALNKAEWTATQGVQLIKRILARGWDERSIALWEELRRMVLMYPTANVEIYNENEIIRNFYVTSGVPQNEYLYSQYSDFQNVVIDFRMDKVAFEKSGRCKIEGEKDTFIISEVSETEARLEEILKFAGMKEFFERNGYATCFEKNMHMMSPGLFHNIYKGAIGEAAGRFILQKTMGLTLQPITDPERFEFFDYILEQDVYIDFKHWKFTYMTDRQKIQQEIIRKMDAIGAKKVYIINLLVGQSVLEGRKSVDDRIVEIPGLILPDGALNTEALRLLMEEE